MRKILANVLYVVGTPFGYLIAYASRGFWWFIERGRYKGRNNAS